MWSLWELLKRVEWNRVKCQRSGEEREREREREREKEREKEGRTKEKELV